MENDATDIDASERPVLVREEVVVERSERAVRSMLHPVVKRLDHALFETWRSMAMGLLKFAADSDGHLEPGFIAILRDMLAKTGTDSDFPKRPGEGR